MAAASDHLLAILVTFLTPLFLGEAIGNHDLATARAAATEAVNSFRPRNAWELFTTIQVVAFSMAAFGSICLSLDEKLAAGVVLRCRSNANALQRSADRAQDRLQKCRAQPPDLPDIAPLNADEVRESFRQAAAAQRAVAEARAAMEGQPPPDSPALRTLAEAADAAPTSPPPAPGGSEPPVAMPPQPALAAKPASGSQPPAQPAARPAGRRLPDRHQMAWATAMASVAAEFTRELDHLPPAEQHQQRMRIAALTDVSQKLSRGEKLDPPPRFPPGFSGFPLPGSAPRPTHRFG